MRNPTFKQAIEVLKKIEGINLSDYNKDSIHALYDAQVLARDFLSSIQEKE